MFNVENKTTQITEAVAVETVVRCTEIDVNGHLNGQHSPNSVKTPLEFLIYVPEGVAITEYQ